MKKIAIVWGLCMICIFGGLTFFGFKYQDIKEYKFLENKMAKLAEEYVIENKINIEETNEITLNILKNYKEEEKFEVKNDTCDGKVVIKKNLLGEKYKAIIKCKNYETKGA